MRRIVVLLLLNLAALGGGGCADWNLREQDKLAQALLKDSDEVQLAFVDKDGTTIWNTATVHSEQELLVSPHQIPETLRSVGSQGMILVGNETFTQFTVKELHEGPTRASGWAIISTGMRLPCAGRYAVDYTTPIPDGTRLYLSAYPQGTPGTTVSEISHQRKIVPLTVITPTFSEPSRGFDEFTFAEGEGELGGASGGTIYILDPRTKLVKIGFLAGGVPKVDDSGWVWLIERPRLLSDACVAR